MASPSLNFWKRGNLTPGIATTVPMQPAWGLGMGTQQLETSDKVCSSGALRAAARPFCYPHSASQTADGAFERGIGFVRPALAHGRSSVFEQGPHGKVRGLHLRCTSDRLRFFKDSTWHRPYSSALLNLEGLGSGIAAAARLHDHRVSEPELLWVDVCSQDHHIPHLGPHETENAYAVLSFVGAISRLNTAFLAASLQATSRSILGRSSAKSMSEEEETSWIK